MNSNYHSLNGAYGNAKALPGILIGLWSENADAQDEAVNEGLWGWACHQYSMYSVTPFVLEDILLNIEGVKANPKEIVRFIRLCLEYGNEKLALGHLESVKLIATGVEIPKMRDLVMVAKDKVLLYIWSNHVSTEDAFFIIKKCS